MTNEMKKEVADKLKQYLDEQGLSANEFAKRNKEICSAGYLSLIVNEKWDDRSPAQSTWNKLANFLGMRGSKWPILGTTNYNKIISLCNDARENARMLAAAGFTGAGKTTALRKYAQANADAFYVEARPDWKRKNLLNKIMKAMGLESYGTIPEKIDEISDKLKSLAAAGNKPVLIIDNAHKLDDNTLLLLETLYCETEYEPDNRFAGIVISGTDVLKRHIEKMAGKDKGAFREFRRRIGYWQRMYRPSHAVVRSICEKTGITDANSISYIKNHCADYGTIRELINNALRVQQQQRMDITPQVLANLHVGEGHYQTA